MTAEEAREIVDECVASTEGWIGKITADEASLDGCRFTQQQLEAVLVLMRCDEDSPKNQS